jgi:Nuclease-related domain
MSELGALRPSRRWRQEGRRVRRYWRSLLAAGATVAVLSIVAPLLPVPFVGQFPVLAILAVLVGIAALPEQGMGWAAGAKGEPLTARALDQLKIEGFVILDDRRLPGMTTNIDYLGIGPSGLAVVETRSAPGNLLAKAADDARRDAVAVAVALTDELERRHLKVQTILCVDRVSRHLFSASPQGVSIVDGCGLVRLLRKAPRKLSAEDVRELARVANDRLRPVVAPTPQLYDPLPVAHPNDRPVIPPRVPSPLSAEGDQSFMPPVRRAHIQAARAARARATDQRMYWSRGGLIQGKAPPTIPPGDPEEG